MHVLVTGAAGFLGRCLVEQLLADGHRVRALTRRPAPELERLGTEVFPCDVRDAPRVVSACQGQEVVFHTAAIAGIWGKWDSYYATNTLGTVHVLEACRRQGVGQLIYTSSPSVTFDGGEQAGVDERVPYARRWLCHYSHSKALAEQQVLAAHDPGSLRTCALRPHLIWGPRDPHLVPRLLERARRGQLRQIGDGENLVDMVYVDNAADAHRDAVAALASHPEVGGRAYFISQGEPVKLWAWINRLLDRAGLPAVERRISLGAAWRIGALLERVYGALRLPGEPRMTRFLAAQLGRSHYFDISAARRDLGYRPRISMDEGMERLVNSWANG
jgi:nucleoside-diphosphate-sugar epimerase